MAAHRLHILRPLEGGGIGAIFLAQAALQLADRFLIVLFEPFHHPAFNQRDLREAMPEETIGRSYFAFYFKHTLTAKRLEGFTGFVKGSPVFVHRFAGVRSAAGAIMKGDKPDYF